MFRTFAIATLTLLTLDAATTVMAPATGISATKAAEASNIRRSKIKRRSNGLYKTVTRVQDDGDASSADAASIELTVCTDEKTCADPVDIGSDGYLGVFKSSRFSYDGAEVPEGEYKLQTNLLNSDGKELGMSQTWVLTAKGGEMSVTPSEDVDAKPYVSELSFSSDDCGTGKAKAKVTGDDADTVATVEWVSLDGLLFAKEEVESCTDGTCVTGELKKGKAAFTESSADLGEVGEALAETEEASVTVSITAYDAKGGEIGTATTEATAKYGDILIDGVPLEFD